MAYKHITVKRMKRVARYRKFRKAGVCGDCGKPVEPSRKGKAYCAKCNKAHVQATTKYKMKRYWLMQKLKVCTACQDAVPAPGRKKCGYCLELDAERKAERRKELAEQGRCPCGELVDGKHKTCASCLSKERARRVKREQRKQKGVMHVKDQPENAGYAAA
jgi:hypothetical protein